MMDKKIVHVTFKIVVDKNVDVEYLIQELDYSFTPTNGEKIYDTELIDFSVDTEKGE